MYRTLLVQVSFIYAESKPLPDPLVSNARQPLQGKRSVQWKAACGGPEWTDRGGKGGKNNYRRRYCSVQYVVLLMHSAVGPFFVLRPHAWIKIKPKYFLSSSYTQWLRRTLWKQHFRNAKMLHCPGRRSTLWLVEAPLAAVIDFLDMMEHSFYGWIWHHSAVLVVRSSAGPQVGWGRSTDSFQVSSEMLDWVQVEPLARSCRVVLGTLRKGLEYFGKENILVFLTWPYRTESKDLWMETPDTCGRICEEDSSF